MNFLHSEKRMRSAFWGMAAGLVLFFGCEKPVVEPAPDPQLTFTMPAEEALHEGTWLQWPHNFGWDSQHVERLESTWVELARGLHTGERVHIITYNEAEGTRVRELLETEGLDLSQLDFFNWPTDDVWVRDNGPIFVRDSEGALAIADFEFNGWGGKAEYANCNAIPGLISAALGIPRHAISLVNEGGSVEIDGRGTLMAKRSSILNNNRNPGWSQSDVESYFKKYLGVSNFIWLDGFKGRDITDDHIDGTARFANGQTIVTHAPENGDATEHAILEAATDTDGQTYRIVHLPITQNEVSGLNDHGLYINYYIGNEVILMPTYGDPNDAAAQSVLEGLYPNRRVIGIHAAELAKDGGMFHCVTQQQPL